MAKNLFLPEISLCILGYNLSILTNPAQVMVQRWGVRTPPVTDISLAQSSCMSAIYAPVILAPVISLDATFIALCKF